MVAKLRKFAVDIHGIGTDNPLRFPYVHFQTADVPQRISGSLCSYPRRAGVFVGASRLPTWNTGFADSTHSRRLSRAPFAEATL